MLCADGHVEAEIADRFGIGERTLRHWKKRHPELLEAMEATKPLADDQVEAAVFKNAVGYEYLETEIISSKTKTKTTQPDGTVVEVEEIRPIRTVERKRHSPPNVVAGIFWLKNRRRQQWGDRQADLDDNEQTKIDELLKRMEGEADAILQPQAGEEVQDAAESLES